MRAHLCWRCRGARPGRTPPACPAGSPRWTSAQRSRHPGSRWAGTAGRSSGQRSSRGTCVWTDLRGVQAQGVNASPLTSCSVCPQLKYNVFLHMRFRLNLITRNKHFTTVQKQARESEHSHITNNGHSSSIANNNTQNQAEYSARYHLVFKAAKHYTHFGVRKTMGIVGLNGPFSLLYCVNQ